MVNAVHDGAAAVVATATEAWWSLFSNSSAAVRTVTIRISAEWPFYPFTTPFFQEVANPTHRGPITISAQLHRVDNQRYKVQVTWKSVFERLWGPTFRTKLELNGKPFPTMLTWECVKRRYAGPRSFYDPGLFVSKLRPRTIDHFDVEKPAALVQVGRVVSHRAGSPTSYPADVAITTDALPLKVENELEPFIIGTDSHKEQWDMYTDDFYLNATPNLIQRHYDSLSRKTLKRQKKALRL